MNDRISDIARADRPRRDRRGGRTVLSAEVIRFFSPPNRACERTDFPTIAFRSAIQPAVIPVDRVDTAPCEYLASEPVEP